MTFSPPGPLNVKGSHMVQLKLARPDSVLKEVSGSMQKNNLKPMPLWYIGPL